MNIESEVPEGNQENERASDSDGSGARFAGMTKRELVRALNCENLEGPELFAAKRELKIRNADLRNFQIPSRLQMRKWRADRRAEEATARLEADRRAEEAAARLEAERLASEAEEKRKAERRKEEQEQQEEAERRAAEAAAELIKPFRRSTDDPNRCPAYLSDGSLCKMQEFEESHRSVSPEGCILFAFPHEDDAPRLPKAGEVWLIFGTVREAAAALRLGYLTMVCNSKFSPLLTDHQVKPQARIYARAIDSVLNGAGCAILLRCEDAEREDAEIEKWELVCEHLRQMDVPCQLELLANSTEQQLARMLERVRNRVPIPAAIPVARSAAEMLESDPEQIDWLIPGVLARNQPAIFGGPEKCMKTSLAAELAVSLGTGRPFMNTMEVQERVNVLFMSGESGRQTLVDLIHRICDSKGVAPTDASLHVLDEILRLDNPASLEVLDREFVRLKTEVFILDPVYLAFGGDGAENLMKQGEKLHAIGKLCSKRGVTLVLVHHTKSFDPKSGIHRPAKLSDLAWAGFKEFARQWVLINRRAEFDHSGVHRLWLTVGGSAGHSGLYGVDISEGTLREGRTWSVAVREGHEAKAGDRKRREKAKAKKAAIATDETKVKLLESLGSEPQTKSQLKVRTDRQNEALAELIAQGTVEVVTVKRAGNDREAYRLAQDHKQTA